MDWDEELGVYSNPGMYLSPASTWIFTVHILMKPYFKEFTGTVYYQAIIIIYCSISNLIIAFDKKRC